MFTEDKGMNKKIGDVIRILLGCYLIFLGVCLWIQVSKAGPTDEQLMTLFAVILIAVGIDRKSVV